MKVKIYLLRDPQTQEIRYIGRTKNDLKIRLRGHISKAKKKKTYKDCWITSLSNVNLKPIIELLTVIDGWEKSYKYEQSLIREYLSKGHKLTNLHDRGEGGKQRNFSNEQKQKISESLKKLYQEGKLFCGQVPLKVFDLNGNFISNFKSYKDCAEFIGVSRKHLECSMQRKAKRLKTFQIRKMNEKDPGKYINPKIITTARLKSDKLLENQEVDNQQPIISLND